MTIQEWAREAREWMEMYFRTGGFNLTTMKRLLSTYPEGESGKESDTVQKKLELYGSMVINVRSLRTFLTQYHPSYTQWIEEIDFILARAAELEEHSMSFTDQKPRIATEEDVNAPWGGNKKNFRCGFCGYTFKVGDYWRWIYTDNGNPLVCERCDCDDDTVMRANWELMRKEFKEIKENKFWWFFNRG